MKIIFATFILFCFSLSLNAQLQVIQYKLDNGFTVILNPDKNANTIFGAVAVNTGSKNDPSDATGISHYLEHLLFKGTKELGTSDYEKEKIHLDSINFYYDLLGNTVDDEKREEIQLIINKHSLDASKYAMPNEFDKLLKTIGSTGINATTSNDLTIYFNEFPSHQIEKWLDIYTHRFQDPVFRSFQSELEVVYEEKNRAMDDMQRRLFTEFSKEFYKGHPYGDKGTLGTIEHLKNPSLTKMYQYFKEYYIANNMCLILTGNFDVETVKPLIQSKFGQLKAGNIPKNTIAEPYKIIGRIVKNKRLTPIKVGLMGFRTVPGGHEDELTLDVVNYLLQNESGTGLVDQLQKDGKLMMAWAFSENLDEAGNQYFIYIPKVIIQSLKGAENEMLSTVNRLKNGEFEDDLLESIKNEMYKNHQLNIEDHTNRAYLFANMFRRGKKYEEIKDYPERLKNITKEDIKRVCNTYFNNDYFVLQSRTGFPKKPNLKKPKFKPVKIDQNKESIYAREFNKIKEGEISNRYIDFENDVKELKIHENLLYVVKNPINDIYQLSIQYHYGLFADADLQILAYLLDYAHPEGKSNKEFKKEISLLGSTYYFDAGSNYFTLHLSGIEKNMALVLTKLNELMTNPQVSEKDFKIVVNRIKTERKGEKEEPFEIARALAQYGIYGENSIVKNRSSAKEISKMNYLDIIAKLNTIKKHRSSIHFSGKMESKKIANIIRTNYDLAKNGPSLVPFYAPTVERDHNEILLLNNKKVVQSNIFLIKNSTSFDAKNYPVKNLFNTYFSGGFSGILTQEIREYRSLAYSSSAKYQFNFNPKLKSYFYTYIGCQADKTNESIELAYDLINNLPEKPERMDMVRSSVKLSQSAEFPNFRNISSEVEALKIKGFKKDPNIESNKFYNSLKFEDIVSFHTNHLKDKKTFIGIYGDSRKFDIERFKKIGKLKEIKMNEVIKF